MAIENVVLARRWFEEVWNQRRTDTIDELLTDESVSHTDSGPLRGKREFKEQAHTYSSLPSRTFGSPSRGPWPRVTRSSSAGAPQGPTGATASASRRPAARSRSAA